MFFSLGPAAVLVILSSALPTLARHLLIDVEHVRGLYYTLPGFAKDSSNYLRLPVSDDGYPPGGVVAKFKWQEPQPEIGIDLNHFIQCHFVGRMRNDIPGDMWWQLRAPTWDFIIPCGDSGSGYEPGSGIQLVCVKLDGEVETTTGASCQNGPEW